MSKYSLLHIPSGYYLSFSYHKDIKCATGTLVSFRSQNTSYTQTSFDIIAQILKQLRNDGKVLVVESNDVRYLANLDEFELVRFDD